MNLDFKILAVDFDGTLCEEKWPEIGEPNNKVIKYVKERKAAGDKLILWTCRIEDKLAHAIEWCRAHGIEFDAVNENVPEVLVDFPINGRKIYYDELIDDKCLSLFELPYSPEEESEHGMKSWAEREEENPQDLIRALKAISLSVGEHSGLSIGLTKNIFNRLIDRKRIER